MNRAIGIFCLSCVASVMLTVIILASTDYWHCRSFGFSVRYCWVTAVWR